MAKSHLYYRTSDTQLKVAESLHAALNDANSKMKMPQGKENLNFITANLSQEQILAAASNNSRGRKWSEKDNKKGLSLRYTCGPRGLQDVSQQLVPMPSVRTLQRRTQHIVRDRGYWIEGTHRE